MTQFVTFAAATPFGLNLCVSRVALSPYKEGNSKDNQHPLRNENDMEALELNYR